MRPPVTKAVIPAAGLGTRFLPATKAQPKEMLTVVDKPAIQYVVEEAVEAGIDDVLIITSPSKRAVEDHFDRNFELESLLDAKGKDDARKQVEAITAMATFHFTRQGAPLGLGHAVSVAARHVGSDPFVVLLPDELMVNGGATLRAMIDAYETHGTSVVALREVPHSEIDRYGCPAVAERSGDVVRISGLVEKPHPDEAPSDLAVMGRYLFLPSVFDHLAETEPGVGGEIQLTDAMSQLAADGELYGCILDEGSYDAGQKLDFLRATVELGLDHDELGAPFAEMLVDIARRRGLVD